LVTGKDDFLTSETYEAISITTKSTIAKIKFLLDEAGFQFVLTRKFNSDNLERKFSALRQANGTREQAGTIIIWTRRLQFTELRNCSERESLTAQ
jgi:hypothetical protein